MTAAVKARVKPVPTEGPINARDLMEKLNADAGKLNIWVRTELNAPAQRAWFTDTGGGSGVGQLAAGNLRVAANQAKALPALWRWKDYRPFLDRINDIASRADVSPIEFADRQSILLTNPGLGGRLQVTRRCAAQFQSIRPETWRRHIFTVPMPAVRSCQNEAAIRMWRESVARLSAAI